MKSNKAERQACLLSLIRENEISTQEDLVTSLNDRGFYATQATISRDIKDLGIIKISAKNGQQKYISMEQGGEAPSGRLMKVFAEAVVQIDAAGNLVIIKTLPGMAQASASALDSMRLPEIAGTIAGDDTVFVACRSAEQSQGLQNLLSKMMVSDTAWKTGKN